MTPSDTAWIPPRAAARYLGLTRRALARLVADGVLTPDDASGARFSVDQLDRYLESTRVRPGELRYLYEPQSRRRGAV